MGSGASSKRLEEVQLQWGESTVQGRRQYNEDRSRVHHPLSPADKPLDLGHSYFGVFDGHGGEWCAEYVSRHLGVVLACTSGFSSTTKSAAMPSVLARAFVACDEQCLAEQATNGEKSGSTGCVLVVDHAALYVANCGDTRAILSRAGEAIELTRDHKPQDAPEKARMEAAGARVPAGSGYVELGDSGLAVARAFGNPMFKQNSSKPADQQVIIAHPHAARIARVLAQDEFVILATDGLWNVCTHAYAVDFVRTRLLRNMDLEDIAHKLTQHALDKKSQDNVTVVLVSFPLAFNGDLLAQVQVGGLVPAEPVVLTRYPGHRPLAGQRQRGWRE